MASKKSKTVADVPLHPNVQNAVENLYHAVVSGQGDGPRSVALAVIAEALEHIVEHHDAAGLKALEHLAKEARKYSKAHTCFQGTREPPMFTSRADLIKGLVALVAERHKGGRLGAENALVQRLLYGSASGVLGVPAPAKFQERVQRELRRATSLGHDDEGLVVAALVGWGLTRRRARDMVKSAMKRGG